MAEVIGVYLNNGYSDKDFKSFNSLLKNRILIGKNKNAIVHFRGVFSTSQEWSLDKLAFILNPFLDKVEKLLEEELNGEIYIYSDYLGDGQVILNLNNKNILNRLSTIINFLKNKVEISENQSDLREEINLVIISN